MAHVHVAFNVFFYFKQEWIEMWRMFVLKWDINEEGSDLRGRTVYEK